MVGWMGCFEDGDEDNVKKTRQSCFFNCKPERSYISLVVRDVVIPTDETFFSPD